MPSAYPSRKSQRRKCGRRRRECIPHYARYGCFRSGGIGCCLPWEPNWARVPVITPGTGSPLHSAMEHWLKKCFWRGFRLKTAAPGWLFLCLAATAPLTAAAQSIDADDPMASVPDVDSRTNGLGSWIWAARTFDRQTCQLWRAFEIPENAAVTGARLRMTADNEHTLFFD